MLRWCSIEIVPRFFRPVVALPIVLCGAAGVAVIDKKASLGHEKAMTYGGAIILVFVLLSVWLMVFSRWPTQPSVAAQARVNLLHTCKAYLPIISKI
jgi:uncharacterized membrane protein